MKRGNPLERPEQERYREALRRERDRQRQRVEAFRAQGLDNPGTVATGELSSYDQHPSDHGTETYERSKDYGLMKQAELIANLSQDALDRMDVGTYGVCEQCGQKIAPERLAAIPYTTLCYNCKAEAEAKWDNHHARPPEEDVLAPPFARTWNDRIDRVEFDGEDAWQAVARFGTANTPQDVPDSIGYDDGYVDADETIGIVQQTDGIIDETGRGVTDFDHVYPDLKVDDERVPHRELMRGAGLE